MRPRTFETSECLYTDQFSAVFLLYSFFYYSFCMNFWVWPAAARLTTQAIYERSQSFVS